jgi:hypothetical protein
MKQLFVVFLASIALASVANADIVMGFTNLIGGTMTYNGVTTAVTMPITELVVTGAPINNGFYYIDGATACTTPNPGLAPCGTTSTTTGTQTGSVGGIATFGAGGSLTLAGSLDNAAGVQVLATGPIITSGSYSSATLNTSTGVLSAFGGVGGDVKSAAFLSFFGLTSTTMFSFDFKASARSGAAPGATFTNAPVVTGSVDNVAPSAVPEPASVALFGTMLLGVAGLLRKKLA